jgi:hypothetical protein
MFRDDIVTTMRICVYRYYSYIIIHDNILHNILIYYLPQLCNEENFKIVYKKYQIIKRQASCEKGAERVIKKKQTGLFMSLQSIIRQSHMNSYRFRNSSANLIQQQQCDDNDDDGTLYTG